MADGFLHCCPGLDRSSVGFAPLASGQLPLSPGISIRQYDPHAGSGAISRGLELIATTAGGKYPTGNPGDRFGRKAPGIHTKCLVPRNELIYRNSS